MPDSIGEHCLQQIVAALDGPGKPVGVSVHRYRSLPFDADQLPALAVYALDEQVQRVGTKQGAVASHLMRVAVEGRVAADQPDQALDPLVQWAVLALLGGDGKLGGYAMDLEQQAVEWAAVTEDKTYGAARVTFAVHYRTRAADLATRL